MGAFGKKGQRGVTKSKGFVELKRSGGDGDFLRYKLTAFGANPIFTLTSGNGREVWSNQQFPHPQQVYERRWPQDNTEVEGDDVMYVLLLIFFNVVEYKLEVTHRDRNNQLVEVIKDIDYKSDEPSDTFPELLRVFII